MSRLQIPNVHLHIGSERLSSGSGGVYDHINPATGEVDAVVPHGSTKEIDMAVEAADRAFSSWKRWRPDARRDVLMKFAKLFAGDADRICQYATMDVGIPVSTTSFHAAFGASYLAYYAGFADKIEGEVTSSYRFDSDFAYTLREPYGVIGMFHTWNGPACSLCMKAGAALAAGNTIVVKPPEVAPFSLEAFMSCAREAGIPEGVINVVHGGPEAGAALVSHPLVRKISFTGGPSGAQKILAGCVEQIKPVVLELGGKSANIVFEDADLEAAAFHATMFSVGLNAGQGCNFPTRLLVHEKVYEQMIERVVENARNFKVGDPWDTETIVGPVVNRASADHVINIVQEAEKQGFGKLVLGGKRCGGNLANGFFVEPTIIRDADNNSRICQEELFGPVLTIAKFSTDDEAIRLANGTDYALGAYIQSKDLERVHRVATELRAGGININGANTVVASRPFGGIGRSGFGREGGRDGLDEFLLAKTVQIGSLTAHGKVSFP